MKRKLADIIAKTPRQLITIAPDATLRSSVELLCEHRIGAVVVVDKAGALRGILSERDLMRVVAARTDLDNTPVSDAMTKDVVVGVDTDDVSYAMSVMTERRIRHMPIMRGGTASAMVSIGDLVHALRTEASVTIRDLEAYITGTYR